MLLNFVSGKVLIHQLRQATEKQIDINYRGMEGMAKDFILHYKNQHINNTLVSDKVFWMKQSQWLNAFPLREYSCWAQSLLAVFFVCATASADEASMSHQNNMQNPVTGGIFGENTQMEERQQGRFHMGQVPAGLMGVYMAKQGHFMLNYMPMWMHMSGMQSGTNSISTSQVASMPAGGNNASPQTYRIVPTQMSANAQMLGGMYGITDDINVMVMGSYMFKNMSMLTYQGMSGSTPLGSSTTTTEGWGDTSAKVMVKLFEEGGHEVHVLGGISIPTGSITQTGSMLSPKNYMMNMRLMYGMQLGDGTYDALPSIVYTGHHQDFSWGLMYQGRYPMQSYNGQGWRIGNFNEGTGWLAYNITHHFAATARVSGSTQQAISGHDPQIQGLSTGVNPNNYGGQVVNGLVGLAGRMPLSMVGIPGGGAARIAFEFGAPMYVNVNGVQSPEKWLLNLSAAAHF
jgi:hypothetical protein